MYLGEKLGTYGVRLWVFARDGFLVHFKIGSGRVVGLALPFLFPWPYVVDHEFGEKTLITAIDLVFSG
jgi:hypothetical protein